MLIVWRYSMCVIMITSYLIFNDFVKAMKNMKIFQSYKSDTFPQLIIYSILKNCMNWTMKSAMNTIESIPLHRIPKNFLGFWRYSMRMGKIQYLWVGNRLLRCLNSMKYHFIVQIGSYHHIPSIERMRGFKVNSGMFEILDSRHFNHLLCIKGSLHAMKPLV